MTPDIEFLLVIGAAVFVKQALSPFHSIAQSAGAALASALCAYVFTGPLSWVLGMDGRDMRLAVAVVLSLTGEHIVRHIIDTGKDPDRGISRTKSVLVKIMDLIATWARRDDTPAPPPATDRKPDETEDKQ